MWRDVTWGDVTWCDVTWRDVRWCDVMWRDVRWRDVMWREVMWGDVTWCDVRWCDVMWREVMWGEVTWRDVRWRDVIMSLQAICDIHTHIMIDRWSRNKHIVKDMRVIWLQSRLNGLNVSKHDVLLSTAMCWNYLHASSKPLPSVQAAFLSCLEPFTVMGPFALFFYLTNRLDRGGAHNFRGCVCFCDQRGWWIRTGQPHRPTNTSSGILCDQSLRTWRRVTVCLQCQSAAATLKLHDLQWRNKHDMWFSGDDGTQFFDHIELYTWTFQIHPNPKF